MAHDSGDNYKGYVEFTRNGKTYRRNLAGEKRGEKLGVVILREYCKNLQNLVEDADIWFNNQQANNYKLMIYNFVKATVLTSSESEKHVRLRMEIKNSDTYETNYITVKIKQTNSGFDESYSWEWEDFNSFY